MVIKKAWKKKDFPYYNNYTYVQLIRIPFSLFTVNVILPTTEYMGRLGLPTQRICMS